MAANLLVFVNYSIWVVSLPLLGAEKFGFGAGQVGMTLLFVNIVHLASAVPIGGIIRKAGAARALAIGFGVGGVGMLLVPIAPSAPWLLVPMALYAVGQVAGNSSAGDLILRLGGGGGRAVGTVRFSSDVGLVAGPAAVGALADAAGVAAPFAVLGVVALAAMATMTLLGRQLGTAETRARTVTTVLRNGILATAERDEVERFIRTSPWSRALVARFVAGDRLEDALMAAIGLAGQGLTTTLDRLGENVLTPTEAAARWRRMPRPCVRWPSAIWTRTSRSS